MNENSACPIWGTDASVPLSQHAYDIQCDKGEGNIPEYQDVDSPRAGGRYRIHKDVSVLLHEVSLKARLTSWLIEQRQLGEQCPEITAKTIENVERRQCLPVYERADRLLRYFGKAELSPGQKFVFSLYTSGNDELYGEEIDQDEQFNMLARIESVTDQRYSQGQEIKFFCDYLSNRGWITDVEFQTGLLSLRLTVEGHAHLEALEHTVTVSSRAFVAMWFDDSMNDVWEVGIGPAIKDAGYEPVRIDRIEHANKIDDEIIAEIRRSGFVVADFTHGDGGARGGVYYEAGFAHGLDIPVIFTCREDALEKVHFDTRQYNHIVWEEPEELRHKLATRIAAVIGDGPLKDSSVR